MKLQSPDPVSGQSNELLERLSSALKALSDSDKEGFDYVSMVLTVKLRLAVSARRDGRDAFVGGVLLRLQSAIATGVSEDLIVLGARDSVTLDLRRMSTNIEQANVNRSHARERFERVLEDPFEMERFIEHARESDPDEPVTENKVRSQINDLLAGPLLRDVAVEGASAWWAMEKAWTDATGLYLSDEDVSEWISKRLSRPGG